MARVLWTATALAGLASVSLSDRTAILAALHIVETFPQAYPVRRRGRYRGHRRINVENRWAVYYRVEGTGEERVVVIMQVIPARSHRAH